MRKILIFLALFSVTFLVAQNHEERWRRFDSLKKVAANMPDDTAKLGIIYRSMLKEISSVNADTAQYYARVGLALSSKLHAQSFTGKFYSVIANYYTGRGEYEQALEMNLAAVRQFDSIGDSSNLARCIMNSGNVLYHLKKFAESLKYHSDALEIYTILDHQKGMADCYMNISNDFWEMGNKDSSITVLERSLQIRRDLNDKRGIAQSLHNLGSSYSELNQFEKAENYLLEALVIKESLRDTFSLAYTYVSLGTLRIRERKFAEAVLAGKKAVDLASQSGNTGARRSAYEVLSEAYSGMDDYKNAYDYHKKFSLLNDSVYSAESDKNISEMKTKYDTEKKEKENVLLEQQLVLEQLESNQQRLINYVIGAIGICVLLLAFVLLWNYRVKQKANVLLEAKNATIQFQKEEVERQKELVEEKQKAIVDSITYAKRIQRALLASEGLLTKHLGEYFVLYRPKDIVSGDFYWAASTNAGKFLVLTGDCTGHGVPGAFMSLLNISYLHEITTVKQIHEPAAILNEQRNAIAAALNAEGAENTSWDGMDCTLCSLDRQNNTLELAGAFNPVWIMRDNSITEYRTDKQPVGLYVGPTIPFTQQKVELQKGDVIYSLTDGFPDQFGGSKGKKYKYARLKEFLVSVGHLTMEEQRKQLEIEFDNWKGDFDQIDDVLVIGIRV